MQTVSSQTLSNENINANDFPSSSVNLRIFAASSGPLTRQIHIPLQSLSLRRQQRWLQDLKQIVIPYLELQVSPRHHIRHSFWHPMGSGYLHQPRHRHRHRHRDWKGTQPGPAICMALKFMETRLMIYFRSFSVIMPNFSLFSTPRPDPTHIMHNRRFYFGALLASPVGHTRVTQRF